MSLAQELCDIATEVSDKKQEQYDIKQYDDIINQMRKIAVEGGFGHTFNFHASTGVVDSLKRENFKVTFSDNVNDCTVTTVSFGHLHRSHQSKPKPRKKDDNE